MTETIRKCTISDTDALLKLSYDTFYEAFASQNTPANMKAYADSAFTQGKIRGELQNPESHFYFIYDDDQLAGYLKVNIGSAQSEDMGSDSLEVERIYILEAFHNKGFGKALLNLAYDIARAEQKKKVWLGVWEKNENALGFYRKQGFKKTGSHSFFMGTDKQTDYIAEKSLES